MVAWPILFGRPTAPPSLSNSLVFKLGFNKPMHVPMKLLHYILIVLVGLLIMGCMGPEVEWVPTSIHIIDKEISDVTSRTAVVTWLTDYEAISRVQIVHQESVSNTLLDTNLTRSHRIEIDNLEPGTFYLLVIQSSNGQGGASFETGAELIFQTLSN